MKGLRRMALLATVASTALLASASVYAQETSSDIRGVVVNAAGQSVGNVTVTITHVPTGTRRTITSDAGGRFSARGLMVGGPYTVKLADGSEYSARSLNDIMLKLGSTESVSLTVGAAEEIDEILVTGTAGSTELKTGAGRSFSRATIDGIPSINRDFVSVLETDSKILVDRSVPRGPAVSIAGANFRFNSVTVDGVAQNDNFGLSMNASATQRTPISIDAIGAIDVNIAPFDVTYGNFLGGNVNIVTKSGSNEFHGSLYGFYTNDGLTGDTSRGQDLAIGDFKETSYGATLGGPIIEDKLFFFANYEKFSTTRPANTQTIDNIVGVTQADVDRVIDIFKTKYGFDPGKFSTTDKDSDEKILLKLDLNINDNHRASATYQRADGDVIFDDFPQLAILNSGRYNINERMDSYSFQVFSDWSDNFSTEMKLGYKDVENRQVSIDSSTPDFAISAPGGGTIAGGGDRFRHNNTLDNSSRIFKFKADYVVGDHLFTAGFEQEHNSVQNTFLPFSRGQVVFYSIDDFEGLTDPFENGLPQIGHILVGGPNPGHDGIGKFSLDTNTLYLQDEWIVNDQLTLNFGVRYDWMNNSDAVVENSAFVTRNGFTNTENLDGKSMFLPRFGFNYEATDRLTIRGGAGLFGGGTPMIMLSNSYSGNGATRTFASFWAKFFDGETPGFITGLINNVAADLPNADAVTSNMGFLIAAREGEAVDAIDPNFELLSSWKYNLAADYIADLSGIGMGDDWYMSAELIYTDVKNGYDVYESRRNQVGTAPDGRPIYDNGDNGAGGAPYCDTFFNCGDYIVSNTSQGSSTIISFDVAKSWETDSGNYDFTFGYTHQNVKDSRSYNRFINFESYSFDPQADFNNPSLSTSKFEVPQRIAATFGWDKEIFGENKTSLNFVYTVRSGRNYSYVFRPSETIELAGVWGGNNLADGRSPDTEGGNSFYVPTGTSDPIVTGDAGFLSSLDSVISNSNCLSEARGTIIARNSCRTGRVSLLNMRFMQEVTLKDNHKIELILDIENLGNMINSNWGRLDAIFQPSNVPLANVELSGDGSQYIYSGLGGSNSAQGAVPNVARIPSVYKVQLGVRYRF